MTIDPQTNLQNEIDQWKQANKQYDTDYAYLTQMIQKMMAALKSGDPAEAFQIAEQCIMPGAMAVQGDTMGQLAATMNLSAAIQNFSTACQNDLNNGASMTQAQADNFTKLLKEIYDDVEGQVNNTDPTNQWLDKTTAGNLAKSMTDLAHQFDDGATPDTLDSGYVSSEYPAWVGNPTSCNSGDGSAPYETGQQHVQNIQSNMTEWNNSVASQSQSLTAQEQFASNTYNQYMNACTDIFQSTQQFVQNIVQHEIAG